MKKKYQTKKIASIISIVAGVLILVRPDIAAALIALYLIFVGIVGLIEN